MAPKLRFVCSGRDDALWEELDEATEEWDKSIRTSVMYRAVGDLILKYTPGDAEVMHVAAKGGHNIIYQLEYKDGSSVIVRIPIKGKIHHYSRCPLFGRKKALRSGYNALHRRPHHFSGPKDIS